MFVVRTILVCLLRRLCMCVCCKDQVGQKSFGQSRGHLVGMFRVVGVWRPVARMERLGTGRRSGDHGGHPVMSHDGLEGGRPCQAHLRSGRSLGLMSALSDKLNVFSS